VAAGSQPAPRAGLSRPSGVTRAGNQGRIASSVTLGFLWLMLALKIPLAALIYIVWWAIKQEPDDSQSSDDDGGVKHGRPHPRPHPPFPRRPRRGPHGDPAPAAPARVRVIRARARSLGH
jgi:hypothetical protein